MTRMEHFLCLLWGCLIGHFIVYGWCRFWDFITRKRVAIPEIKYDVTDNPILTLKNRLGQAYVATYDRTAKKLLHRLLEYIEWIDNWHKEQVLIVENDRNGYKRKAERLQAEFESECSKNAELEKQLKSIGEKYVFCYNMLQKEMLSDWKPIERAENVREALCAPQDWQNTYSKEPIPVGYSGTAMTATEATELAEHLMNMTSQPIVLDSEALNEPQIKNEEFIKQLRDWWGLEADTNKWPDFMMKVNCVPKEWNRYKVTVQDKCGVTYTDYDWAPSPMYLIHKYKESGFIVLSYDLDNPVYRGEESTT